MPEGPRAKQAGVKVVKALGQALAAIRKRKGMTVDDVVRNTRTFYDAPSIEAYERGEETFLDIPGMVRLIVEGFHADPREVGELMGEYLKD